MGKNQSLNLPYPLILASTSKYRKALLEQLGWPFEALSPGVDEDKIKGLGKSPEDIAQTLATYKAQAVHALNSHACVIGSIEKATEQISFMQGKKHELLTAVTIIYPGGSESFINRTTLHMRSLTLSEIHAYVKEDLPLDCAGSYKLESKGIKLFHKIEMEDQTAIIGLPLIELTNRLLKLGYPL